MKIAVYSPYLDTAGGGEKYMLTIAEAYAGQGEVDLLLDPRLQRIGSEKIRSNLDKIHQINWQNINFKNAPLGEQDSFLKKFRFTKKYDLLFYLSDGSLFLSGAKKSFLHIQMPLAEYQDTWVNNFKLKSWRMVIYNSIFTQGYMKEKLKLVSKVIYPPVDVDDIRPLKKKNIIVNIGRFVRVKRQDVLINVFKEMFQKKMVENWELILMGGLTQADLVYLEELKKASQGVPIKILTDIPRLDLIKTLGEAKIYWHAMGYESDDPVQQEHFGISVVEAMAAGCIPVVINKGGLNEIVDRGKYGVLWETTDELITETLKVIQKKDLDSQKIIERSNEFSKEHFMKRFLELEKK